MIGLSITLGGKSWGCGDFKGAWGVDRTEFTAWTEESCLIQLGEACMFLKGLLEASHKRDVTELVGLPIEVTLDGNKLVSWCLLTEVLP